MNYGAQRYLAEPFGSRQQDNIYLVDMRVEKEHQAGREPVDLRVHRRLQLDKHELRVEHQLGFWHHVPPADDDRAPAAVAVRRKVRLVESRDPAGAGADPVPARAPYFP